MSDLLLELFSEEIPARMQLRALEDLQGALNAGLTKAGFAPAQATGFVTPRRLAVIIGGLPAASPDISTELKGPKVGAPEAAMQGFLKKNNLQQSDLTEKDGVYFAHVHQKGKPTAELLKPLIEEILAGFPWPKSMRWGSGDTTWVRPLHSILCLLDGKVVPVEFAGLTAGSTTRGHRFLSPDVITINDPAEYEAKLEKAHVIASRDKRKAVILAQAEKAASAKKLSLKKDDALLEEVTGLVEWPVALMGTIDAQFMDLPPEVLTTVMRSHQKYFALISSPNRGEAGRGAQSSPSEQECPPPNLPPLGGGILSPHFLIVANMITEDGGKAIIAGNERVLRARFSDARFFWDQDRKKPLSEWAAGLETVTYHAKLGSIADKVARIEKLSLVILSEAKNLCKDPSAMPQDDKVKRAARLCKADLVTGMVGEFAELQGIMGRYYALQQKEDAAVADAIRDHYKPQGPGDSVPSQPVSICIALADKLDTLTAMFAIGEKPTGSKDPFALRRAALGVIRIILENKLRLPLTPLFAGAPMRDIALHKAHEKLVKKTEADLHDPARIGKYLTVNETACSDIPEGAATELAKSLLDFFIDRLKVQLKDQGMRHDVIAAVVANGDDDLVRVVARAKALQDFLGSEDGKNLLAAYKRAANILAIEEKKDKATYAAMDLKTQGLKENEETALATLLTSVSTEIETLRKDEKFEAAMKRLAALRAPVDAFFDKILVNCDDKDLRANRLRLLASIKDGMDSIANFALIEG